MIIQKLKQLFGFRETPRVSLIPWNSSHSGNFEDGEEAYTLLVDGNRTNISFAIEEGDANAPEYTKVTMKIPRYVERYGVEIEPNVLESYESNTSQDDQDSKEQKS